MEKLTRLGRVNFNLPKEGVKTLKKGMDNILWAGIPEDIIEWALSLRALYEHYMDWGIERVHFAFFDASEVKEFSLVGHARERYYGYLETFKSPDKIIIENKKWNPLDPSTYINKLVKGGLGEVRIYHNIKKFDLVEVPMEIFREMSFFYSVSDPLEDDDCSWKRYKKARKEVEEILRPFY